MDRGAGEGAFLNGKPLTVSAKTDLDAAIVTMTQPRTLNRSFGDAVATLVGKVQFIRSTVPSTFRDCTSPQATSTPTGSTSATSSAWPRASCSSPRRAAW